MQLDHYTSKFVKKKFPIVLVADQVLRPTNVGSLFRLADAFGVEKLILGGPPIELNSSQCRHHSRSHRFGRLK